MTFLHPLVLAEQEKRREETPKTCHFAWGFVHRTASKPRAEWCVRPLDHAGLHMNEARYAEYRALATARQHRKRETT